MVLLSLSCSYSGVEVPRLIMEPGKAPKLKKGGLKIGQNCGGLWKKNLYQSGYEMDRYISQRER